MVKVSIPSEFTLLSNFHPSSSNLAKVSIPSEFTLLSNLCGIIVQFDLFQYPLNLHCSQTATLNYISVIGFNTL